MQDFSFYQALDSLLQSKKRFLEKSMWFFLGNTSLSCSYSVNSNIKCFISFISLDTYKTGEYQTRAISQQTEMWKQKVKFWFSFTECIFTFLTILNSPLQWWNCKYKLSWNYILRLSANQCQRDSPQILTFRLLLRLLDQSMVHSCMNVSEQHSYKVTNTYNARHCGELSEKLDKLSYT